MTIETFLTNVINLAVENELMVQIPGVFTMEGILQKLSIEDQEELVQESAHLKKIRKTLTEDLENLNKGKELCDRWMKDNKSESKFQLNCD